MLSKELVEQLAGREIRDDELELVEQKFEELLEYERRLLELDIAHEEPVTAFSRESFR